MCIFVQAISLATYIKESIFSMLVDISLVDKILIARNNVPFMRTNKTFMLDKDLINGSLNILTRVKFKALIKFLFIGIEKRLTAPIIYSVYNYLILSEKKDISSISYRFLAYRQELMNYFPVLGLFNIGYICNHVSNTNQTLWVLYLIIH